MVLYFSGTGNSQFAALRLAEMIEDDEVVSINQYIKEGRSGEIQSKRPLVFVAPTYCWRMPRVLEQWIMRSSFREGQDVYFILTCGDDCGNAAFYAEKLCAKKNMRFCGLAPLVMPENYLALFPTPGEVECRSIMEKAELWLAELAQQINSGKSFTRQPAGFGGKLKSGPANPLFYSVFVHDKGFAVSDDCVSCGKCAQRCPLNNIAMADGKPTWKGNCTHCMACIGGCPAKAIEYRSKSKGRRRHYIMKDSLCWGKED